MVVGSIPEGFETVDLMYKGGDNVFGDGLTALDVGTGVESGIYVGFFS